MLPIRWEPRREFREVERFLDRATRRPFQGLWSWPVLWDDRIRPALDVYETPEQLVVKAAIPGVKPQDLQITVREDTLVIHGESKEEHQEKEEHYYLRERRAGTFHRAVALPPGLDTEKAEATFEDGVLSITFPKTERAKAKEIKVTVKETAKAKK